MDGTTKEKGWLRNIIAEKKIRQKTRLTDEEYHVLMVVSSLFCGYSANNGNLKGHVSAICHAFNITNPTLRQCMNRFIMISQRIRSMKGFMA